jgi:hypothetical protein
MYVRGSRKKKCPVAKAAVAHTNILTLDDGAHALLAVAEDGVASVHKLSNLGLVCSQKVFSQGGFRVARAVSSDCSGLLLTISRENRLAVTKVAYPLPIQAAPPLLAIASGGGGGGGAAAAPPQGKVGAMFTSGLATPTEPPQQSSGMLARAGSLFRKKESTLQTQLQQREALLGKTVDDRDDNHVLSRKVGCIVSLEVSCVTFATDVCMCACVHASHVLAPTCALPASSDFNFESCLGFDLIFFVSCSSDRMRMRVHLRSLTCGSGVGC